jgi:homopolymeric O-antigen transport system ATP-binding protein
VGDLAISAHRLGKQYELGLMRYGYHTLREGIVRTFRRPNAPRPDAHVLWALRDVSVDVRQGEVVGIIGHNGAGKSTFLKILSRITEPTEGYVDLRGRVGSLLEVGTGFHPELTGRENVYLNGSIIGMSRAEIRRRFDEIVAFAEIDRFLDTPVKRYSSGMSVRLAFAVAAHLEPEILLVDEVLAVGDAAFQRKSLGKMGEVANEGRTVLFVSHNLAIIRALCPRAVLLDHGGVVADGPVGGVLGTYLRALERSASTDLVERTDRNPRGWQQTKVAAVEVHTPEVGEAGIAISGAPATITVRLTEGLPGIECRLTLVNSLAQPIATLSSEEVAPGDVRESSGRTIECCIDSLSLVPGRYRIDVLIRAQREIQDGLEAAAFFDVEPGVLSGRPVSAPSSGAEGDVAIAHKWRLPA